MIARVFLKEHAYITKDGQEDVHDSVYNVKEIMIAFTTYHVARALIAASENSVKMSSTKETVRNSYDLNNIK